MAKLTINKFSCIEKAEIDLASLTIIIGPQASGKSLIAKLVYFFNSIMLEKDYISDRKSSEDFKSSIKRNFLELFPSKAWGKHKFSISFESGLFTAKIARTSISSSNISISFSKFFEDEYNSFLEAIHKLTNPKSNNNPDLSTKEFISLLLDIQKSSRAKFAKSMDGNDITYQLFIPAGRSFFTTLGKTFETIEKGNLDKITTDFGRFITRLRQNPSELFENVKLLPDVKKLWEELLGGKVIIEPEGEYLVSNDKREIPMSFLSSGQQELFPLWLALVHLNTLKSINNKTTLFIEEPEAHLFPSSQSDLIAYIASLTTGKNKLQKTIITTHSPYILAKINNLLKAGYISTKYSTKNDKINKIVPKEFWLKPGSVAAYSIEDNKTIFILDEDGIIDGSYIDKISEDISKEFSALLDIEYGNAKK